MSTLRTYVGDKLVAIGDILEKPYQRPSNYPSITEPTASEEKIVVLMRVYKPFGTGNSARNTLHLNFTSSSGATFTITGSDGTSQTLNSGTNYTVAFSYDNATSYAIDINSAVSGTGYYIEDLGDTSQTDWNTLAGTSGVTYVVGDYITADVAGSTLSNTTGTVSIYNFRHIVVTATGTNWTSANRSALPVARNVAFEEIYVSLPNYNNAGLNGLNFIRHLYVQKNVRYIKYLTNLSSITDASSFSRHYTSLVEFNCPSDFLQNATNMTSFFNNCYNLTKASLFDTSHVTTAVNFFSGCANFPAPLKYNLYNASDIRNLYFNCASLRIAGDLSFPNATNAQQLFSGCSNLQEIGNLSIPNCTSAYRLFNTCRSLKKVGTITASSATNWLQAFSGCNRLESIDNITFPSTGTFNISQIYIGCFSLRTAFIPSGGSYSNASNAFNNTFSLEEIKPAGVTMDFSSITNNGTGLFRLFRNSGLYRLPNITFSTNTFTGNTVHMFAGMTRLQEIPAYDFSALSVPLGNNELFRDTNQQIPSQLQRIQITGIASTFTVRHNSLSAAALDELMTNCATVTGKTMDLRNNPGASTCDTTIATNKGWTVTT
nr:bacterial surface protein [uncultured Mediterranean phage uvMED]